jgi:hypothetical protein
LVPTSKVKKLQAVANTNKIQGFFDFIVTPFTLILKFGTFKGITCPG